MFIQRVRIYCDCKHISIIVKFQHLTGPHEKKKENFVSDVMFLKGVDGKYDIFL